MILRKRVIGSLLRTRQYPDYDTPAHSRAREASAARAASFKSRFWKVTFLLHRNPIHVYGLRRLS
jgi:hypothetical protein